MIFCVPAVASDIGTNRTVELLNACLVVPLSVLDCTFPLMDRPIVVVDYIVVEFVWRKCTASPRMNA